MDITQKAVVEPPKNAAAQPATVTTDDIVRRAYDLYLARGREDGHDVEDWMQVEREWRTGSAAA